MMQDNSQRNNEREFSPEANPLFRLGDLDSYELEADEPNVQGWKVIGNDGIKLGKVDELIVDTKALKVRYLDISLVDTLSPGTGEPHLLVPIGLAQIDEERNTVRINGVSTSAIPRVPLYNPGVPITRDVEWTICNALGCTGGRTEGSGRDDDFYEQDHFRQDRPGFGARPTIRHTARTR